MATKAQLARLTEALAHLDDDDLHAVEAFAAFLASRHTGPETRARQAGWSREQRRGLTARRDAQAAESRGDDDGA